MRFRLPPVSNVRLSGCGFFIALAFLLSTLFPPTILGAQSEAGTADPSVQKLYSEAMAAEARGDLTAAIAKYESIMRVAPRLTAAYNNLGALYVKQRDYRKAIDVLQRGLKIDPSMSSASALLGVAMFAMGMYGEARPHLEAVLRSKPEDNSTEILLATDLMQLGDFEAAEGHLQQLSRRQPEDQQVWYLLANVYTKLSEKAFSKVDALNPNSVLPHELKGDILMAMNNYSGALVEYKKAVDLGPDQPGTHFKLGDAYRAQREWDAATREFQAELAIDPDDCMAQWKLGNIVLDRNRSPEEALSDVNKALEICPELPEAKLDRGRALLRLNRVADALGDLEAAEQAIRDVPDVHYLLAQAYRSLGRANDAQREMQIFIELDAKERAARAQQLQPGTQDKENAPER